jgi:transcription initiation factor TFIID subunit TAF12
MLMRGAGRVGRPGLIGMAARTAVVAGTATAVSGRVARRQQGRYEQSAEADAYEQQQAQAQLAAQQQAAAPPPPPPPAPGEDDMINHLKQLADLHDQGILTDEEFAAQKARILGG